MTQQEPRWVRDLTFVATGPGGKRYYVHQETRTTTRQHAAGSDTTTRGESRLVTSTGGAVDRVEKGGYVVRSTGMVLVSDDRDAP